MMHRHAAPLAFAIAALFAVTACSKADDTAESKEGPRLDGPNIPSINGPANQAKDVPPPGSKPIPGTKGFYSAPVQNSPAKEF